jgi:ATP synthase protein I
MNYLLLGFQIAALIVGGILGGIGLGYLVDKYLGIEPWGVIIGIIMGVALSSVLLGYAIKNLK